MSAAVSSKVFWGKPNCIRRFETEINSCWTRKVQRGMLCLYNLFRNERIECNGQGKAICKTYIYLLKLLRFN